MVRDAMRYVSGSTSPRAPQDPLQDFHLVYGERTKFWGAFRQATFQELPHHHGTTSCGARTTINNCGHEPEDLALGVSLQPLIIRLFQKDISFFC